MRTCPNYQCRVCHDDSVNQCPECGANMNRTPDQPKDVNTELYAARSRAMMDRGLESRLASRKLAGRGSEFDVGAPQQVKDAGVDLAADVIAFMFRGRNAA